MTDEFEDERVARSTRALRQAMSQLLQEQTFEEITVQQILDRAGVARATFYKHYRSKDDVLAASFEAMLGSLEDRMRSERGGADRLVPVRELLEHVGSANAVLESLRVSGRLDRFWDEMVLVFGERLEPRLQPAPGSAPGVAALTSRVIAGALVEMVRWWLAHPGIVTPQVLDARFHDMARRTAGAFGCAVGPRV